MSSKSILGKFQRLDQEIFSVSQFSHTGEGYEDRLAEPDTVIANSVREFTVYINHILKRIDEHQPKSSMLQAEKENIESLKEKVLAYPDYKQYVITFEYLKKFTTTPTYTVIVRRRVTGEVLTMTHVAF